MDIKYIPYLIGYQDGIKYKLNKMKLSLKVVNDFIQFMKLPKVKEIEQSQIDESVKTGGINVVLTVANENTELKKIFNQVAANQAKKYKFY